MDALIKFLQSLHVLVETLLQMCKTFSTTQEFQSVLNALSELGSSASTLFHVLVDFITSIF